MTERARQLAREGLGDLQVREPRSGWEARFKKIINMIKIFRRIRYALMEKNKTGMPASRTGRYLKYAMGEIMLVVIGILIALQINNWNQDRISKNEFSQTMLALSQDIGSDITILESYISSLKAQEEAAQLIIPILENRAPTFDAVDFYDAFMEMSNSINMDLNTEVWDEIRKSGYAKAYADPELVEGIQNYYHRYIRSSLNWENEIKPRIEMRGLKYELLDQADLGRLRVLKDSMIPSQKAFDAIMKEKRVVDLTKRIEYSSTIFIRNFMEIKVQAIEILELINQEYGSIGNN